MNVYTHLTNISIKTETIVTSYEILLCHLVAIPPIRLQVTTVLISIPVK